MNKLHSFVAVVVCAIGILSIALIITLSALVLTERDADKLSARVQELEQQLQEQTTLTTLTEELLQEIRLLRTEVQYLREQMEQWELLEFEVTAYAPLDPNAKAGMCHDGNPHSTSTGSRPTWPAPGQLGTIAVNPQVIEYGSLVVVPGWGVGVASDTGSAMRARTDLIDICVSSLSEARAWGRRTVVIAIRREAS